MSEPLHLVDTTMFWSPTGGGVRRYLETKHAWMVQRPGWRHTLAVPLVEGATANAATLPSWPLPFSNGYRLPVDRAAISRTLVALAPDVIEAGDPYRAAWGTLDAAQRCAIPAVAYCHSNLESMARLAAGPRFAAAAARVARRYAKHVYSGFDLVLAPSCDMTARLADWGIARVACQPLGVDSTAFRPSLRSAAWRMEQGFDGATRVLVYAGRFAPEKHLDVLADAVRRLGAPYVLVAIGAGPTPPPASERVRVLPFMRGTEALATALASADAFVHAGDQETFGLSVLEAMACGTPVVVRNAGGLAELVDERVGRSVESGDGAAFASAVASLFEHDRGTLGAAARERAEAHDWNEVFAGLLGHYQRVLGQEGDTRTGAAAATAPAASPRPAVARR